MNLEVKIELFLEDDECSSVCWEVSSWRLCYP
jgi:hypothetical protein